ncbi:MAG: MerR family transcriptional regulator, partial [Deltaproteobacteria bacterium]
MTVIHIHVDDDSTNVYRSLMQYTVRAAALATGFSGDRIRTWERRYGVPSPARSSTGRRLYEESDLAIIRRMAALVDSGLSAVSAAKAVHEEAAQSIVH